MLQRLLSLISTKALCNHFNDFVIIQDVVDVALPIAASAAAAFFLRNICYSCIYCSHWNRGLYKNTSKIKKYFFYFCYFQLVLKKQLLSDFGVLFLYFKLYQKSKKNIDVLLSVYKCYENVITNLMLGFWLACQINI